MKIRIKFENLKYERIFLEFSKKIVNLACEELKIKNHDFYELSLLIVDDNCMKKINKEFREINKSTNVLSFPMLGGGNLKNSNDELDFLIGDIVLSIPKIKDESKKNNKKFFDHYAHMLLHGFLHLLGYNHDSETKAKIMEKKEINILSRMKIDNPYVNKFI